MLKYVLGLLIPEIVHELADFLKERKEKRDKLKQQKKDEESNNASTSTEKGS
jgi:uncharacterized metal-binding protein